MRLRNWLIIRLFLPSSWFPGSAEEYYEAEKIHLAEVISYRTQPQYIVGSLLVIFPMIYLWYIHDDWVTRSLLVLAMVGDICLRDTISEHYCILLYRKKKQAMVDEIKT